MQDIFLLSLDNADSLKIYPHIKLNGIRNKHLRNLILVYGVTYIGLHYMLDK